jgi:osmotically-inducible protein OsmY
MFDRLTSNYRERVQPDDDDLQQTILDRLDDDPAYRQGRRLRVTVEVNDGEVTVRGSVRTALERRKVDIIARALGAVTVNNEIVVADEQSQPRGRVLHAR